jgi:hypothetical protein
LVYNIISGFVVTGMVVVLATAFTFGGPGDPGFPVVLFVLPFAAWAIMLVASAVWGLFGWEHLRIRGDELRFERTIFGHTVWSTSFSLTEVKNVRLDPRLEESGGRVTRWLRQSFRGRSMREQTGFGDGAVHFDAVGRTVRVGEGLRDSPDVARDLVVWLRNRAEPYQGIPQEDSAPSTAAERVRNWLKRQ